MSIERNLGTAGDVSSTVIGGQFAANPPVAALTVMSFVIAFLAHHLWDFHVIGTALTIPFILMALCVVPMATICLFVLFGAIYWIDIVELQFFISFAIIYFFTWHSLFKKRVRVSEAKQRTLVKGWAFIGVILAIIQHSGVFVDLEKSISGWTWGFWIATLVNVFYACEINKNGIIERAKSSGITAFVLSVLFTYWFCHIVFVFLPKSYDMSHRYLMSLLERMGTFS